MSVRSKRGTRPSRPCSSDGKRWVNPILPEVVTAVCEEFPDWAAAAGYELPRQSRWLGWLGRLWADGESGPSWGRSCPWLRPAVLHPAEFAGRRRDPSSRVGQRGVLQPGAQHDGGAGDRGVAVLLLPYSLVGPFAGVFLDRWRRRHVLVCANLVCANLVRAVLVRAVLVRAVLVRAVLVRAVLVCGVAGLLVTTGRTGPAFCLVALGTVSVNRLHASATGAALPHVVDTSRLVTANATLATFGYVAVLLGGGIGLAVRTAGGGGDRANAVVAVLAAACYAESSIVASGFGPDRLGPDSFTSCRAPPRLVVPSWRSFATWPPEQRTPGRTDPQATRWPRSPRTGSSTASQRSPRCCSTGNYFTTDGVLLAGLGGAAQVVAASTAGILLGAVVTPWVTARTSKPAWIVILFGTASAVEVGLGVPYQQAPLLIAAVLLGVVAQGSKICVDTIVQESIAEAFRGRVFSFYDTLFNVAFVAASVSAALVLPASGKSYPVLAIIATGYALTALAYGITNQRTKHREVSNHAPYSRAHHR